MKILRSFASDNNAGAHPRILEALAAANTGTSPAYGTDPYTEEAEEALKRAFGPTARPWLVFLGTAANVLGLKCMVQPHQCVLCAKTAHIYCDECGAPEAVTGSKLMPLPSYDGKIRVEDCLPLLPMRQAVHHTYPRVLSISQSTERGTVYTLDELRAVKAFCREHDLYLHLDGARLANAAAALGVSLKELTTDIGVDVVSFGGTKNGLLFGEAVVFLNDEIGHEFGYVRKQHMQLLSKMRYMAVQFSAYLKDDLWLENARAANRAAALLAERISGLEHVRIEHPVEVNAVFARMPKSVSAKLQEQFYFYVEEVLDADGKPSDFHVARLMTSFDTTDEDVIEFAEAVRNCDAAV